MHYILLQARVGWNCSKERGQVSVSIPGSSRTRMGSVGETQQSRNIVAEPTSPHVLSSPSLLLRNGTRGDLETVL